MRNIDVPYTQAEVDRASLVAQRMLDVVRADQTPGEVGMLATIMLAQTGISTAVDTNALSEERALAMVAWYARILGDSVLVAMRANAEVRRIQEEKGLS